MDEEEYDDFLRQIDALEWENNKDRTLQEQCRDEDGIVVPGCSYVLPAPFDQ